VNSQVDGGTASSFVCRDATNVVIASGTTGANGDGSVSAPTLPLGTYTCTG
jgi:hypothetical protein